MDITLQAYQLTADSPKKSDDNKTYSVSSKKDFGEYLENTKSIKEKPNNKTQENDILLMQLLNLLNLNISAWDFEAVAGHQLSNPDTELGNIDFGMEFSVDELNKCWQEILSEYNTSGNINQDTVKMFYLAMKKAIPDMAEIDLKVIQSQINGMLENSDLENGLTEDLQINHNGFTKKHNSAMIKVVDQDGIENDGSKKPKIWHLKQSTKDDSYGNVVRNQNRKVLVENNAVYNELQDHWTVHMDNNLSRYNHVSPFSLKESFVTSLDKADTNIVTSSAGSYHTSDIFEQLVDKMHLAFKGDVQQVSIRLKPDHLGNVLIKVFAEKDKLKAELFVDNTQVRTMLKVHALDFQNQIREQGYNISEINVYKMSDGLEMGAFNHQSNSNNHYQAKRFRLGFNKQATENREGFVKDHYDLWGNASNVNYMA